MKTYSWSARLAFAGIGIATLLLALGYAFSGRGVLAAGMIVLGVVWALWQYRGGGWASPSGLGLVVAAAAAGLWMGVGGEWMLGAVVAALGAWDLDQFERRLAEAGRVEGRPEMERRHLLRLGIALLLGLLLGTVALQGQLRFSFLAGLLLAALATLGIGELIVYLRQGTGIEPPRHRGED